MSRKFNYDKQKKRDLGKQSVFRSESESSYALPPPPCYAMWWQVREMKALGCYEPGLSFQQASRKLADAKKVRETVKRFQAWRKAQA